MLEALRKIFSVRQVYTGGRLDRETFHKIIQVRNPASTLRQPSMLKAMYGSPDESIHAHNICTLKEKSNKWHEEILALTWEDAAK